VPTIYTDGHSEEVTDGEAKKLRLLIEPHPGAGAYGIREGDFRLNLLAQWKDVHNVLDELRR